MFLNFISTFQHIQYEQKPRQSLIHMKHQSKSSIKHGNKDVVAWKQAHLILKILDNFFVKK